MDLLWMILPVFLLCAEAENLTEVRVELGHNVTLNCSLTATDVYWYMEIYSNVRALITRTYSPLPTDAQFYVHTTVMNKFKVSGNRLVIQNITSEDCRLYFCAEKLQGNIVFNDTFRLVSDVPTVTPSTNDYEANDQQQPASRTIWQSESVVFSSLALNVLLVLLLIGLVCTSLRSKEKSRNSQVTEPSPFTPETLEIPQYEEIQLPTYRDPLPVSPPLECIYSKAQLPRQ